MSLIERTVLIVDDSPEDRVAFMRFLRGQPEVQYRFGEAGTVAEAMEQLRAQAFDVILLDYGLPDDTGLAFLRQLIAEHGPHYVAVIMVTGLGDGAVAAAAMKLGAQDYLVKGRQLERDLGLVIASAIEKAGLQRQVELQRRDLEESNRKLRETVAALEEERTTLARRVAERTADLSLTNAALARALRLKDEFLANMSHELRTPLTAVLARAEALREGIYGPLTGDQHAALISIDESGRHLLALITDILDLSKIEAGRLTLELEEVSVDLICRQSLRLVSQIALTKQIALTSTIDSAVDLIYADVRRLKQILVNLLSNAVKFTPNGGKVGLEVRGDPARQMVTFTVWDTGIGIAADDIQRLFQPFVQLDSGLNRQHEGSGLGLALVRRLAEAHGGSVAVESAPGAGSRFSVSLSWVPEIPRPWAEPHQIAPRPEASPIRQALVIEDSPSAAQQLARYLTEIGIQVEIYAHGVGAIERVLLTRPDVIVLDILLPGESGWEVLRQLKSHPNTLAIPVVVVSVLNEPERGRALGADAYLVKPLLRDLLIETLSQIAARRAADPIGTAIVIAPPPPQPRPLILLAEDNEMSIEVLRDYLVSHDYEVAVARNGREAIAQAGESRPALILMDIQMPEVDGLEAMRRIRALPGLHRVPIIAVTALAMPGDRERCLEAGANLYLTKPLSLRALLAAIGDQLR